MLSAYKNIAQTSAFEVGTPGLGLPADPPGQADITWHDGHALGVDGAEVGVFENPGDVGLCSFLKCKESTTPIKSFRSRT